MQNLLGKWMYWVFSLSRACCSGRLHSLIESNELQGVSWDPSQILCDGIWLITCLHPAPLQSPCTALSLLPGRQQHGGCCCFPWEELLLQVAQSESQDSENSLGMWMPNFSYISRVQFSDSVQQLSAEKQDSSQSIKSYIQKLKLSSVHFSTCISWLGFQQKWNNHHTQVQNSLLFDQQSLLFFSL